jgi:hypothetical protein
VFILVSGYTSAWEMKPSHSHVCFTEPIKGASTGKLKSKRIAVKDNIMVAGVP